MTKRLMLLVTLLLFIPSVANAEKQFSITSDPPSARVEINSKYISDTPLVHKVKDYLFNGPKYVWSDWLGVPLQLTISKEGYVPKTIVITRGPFIWVNGNYTVRRDYYVITSTSFHIKLDRIGEFLGTNPLAANTPNPSSAILAPGIESKAKLSTEQVVQTALPAVVTVKAGMGSGSGFFITDSGVVVTNKHVVEGSQMVSVITAKGESFSSESVFVHPTKDLALIKLKGASFPYLKIANPITVNVGADVFAMGSPALPGYTNLLPNTVTKGIISAFRNSSEFGILVQTDASINHGNSGGPLLNSNAEVVAVNSLAFREGGATGINFAIFSSEVLQMLKEHFNYTPQYFNEQQAKESKNPAEQEGKAIVNINSEPEGAEIYVDSVFNSSTPSKLLLPLGEHTIKISRPGYKVWERRVTVENGSSKSFNAILEKDTKNIQ